jgi:hypothetical protein
MLKYDQVEFTAAAFRNLSGNMSDSERLLILAGKNLMKGSLVRTRCVIGPTNV